MTNPFSPHIIGITLDGQGVALTKVIITNQTTGERQAIATDANKRAIVDCANFTSGYTNGDIIEIENVGASYGGDTVTIDTSGGLQETTIDSTAASTTAVIGM